MVRTERIYSIFVASPDDVSEEREVLEDVIRELNKSAKGYRFDLLRWETDAFPGVGDDPQQVISEAIGNQYDILLGILWTRLGTPTARYASGTVEEFERAYARLKEDQQPVRIMLYFKDAPVALSKLDPKQLTALTEFRESLHKKGCLYWTFHSTEELAQLVRLHLPKQIDKISPRTADKAVRAPAPATLDAATGEDEERGFLNLLEDAEDGFKRSAVLMGKIASETNELGARIKSHAEELNALATKHGQPNIRATRRVCDLAADDMDTYSSHVALLMSDLGSAYNVAFDSVGNALAFVIDIQPDDLSELRSTVAAARMLTETVQAARESVDGFRASARALPRMTTKLIRARKRLIRVLSGIIAEFDRLVIMVHEVELAITDRERAG
jgi:hypothetical protein